MHYQRDRVYRLTAEQQMENQIYARLQAFYPAYCCRDFLANPVSIYVAQPSLWI
jgi:hypothetical protein